MSGFDGVYLHNLAAVMPFIVLKAFSTDSNDLRIMIRSSVRNKVGYHVIYTELLVTYATLTRIYMCDEYPASSTQQAGVTCAKHRQKNVRSLGVY